MRLVLFEGPGAGRGIRPGVLTDEGVVDVSGATRRLVAYSAQELMVQVIDNFDDLRPSFEKIVSTSTPLPVDIVRLRPPLPRPGKFLNCIANYWEHDTERQPRALNMFLKNSDCVIGHGDTIVLPEVTEQMQFYDGPGPYVFQHEAELGLVIKGPSKNIKEADWRKAVFGCTGIIDVSARLQGRQTWRQGSWMGKSFDTFGPIGPCITTLDEIGDPNQLRIRFFNNGELYHDYVTNDMEHQVPSVIEYSTTIMTMHTGDVIACGTNHEGLGPLQDGEVIEMETEKVGTMRLYVKDPLKRTWERNVYLGPGSTNREAVERAVAEGRDFRSHEGAGNTPGGFAGPNA